MLAYLQDCLSLKELTNWAENALLESDYEDDDKLTIRNALAQLGLVDVKAFGLEWKDCESIMKSIGYKLEVKALKVASNLNS